MYPVIPSSRVAVKRRRLPKLQWPLELLAPGQAFIVPISGGRDPEGRSVAHLRVAVTRAAERLDRRFTCAVVDGGLAVTRTA